MDVTQGIVQCQGAEGVCAPQAVPLADGHWYGVGSGWLSYATALQARLGDRVLAYQGEQYPQAEAMIPLAQAAFRAGQMVTAAEALPVYLRNKVV
jgi:tRNA threonylcarbamoyladenosine biosynthesis protein TsaB